MDLDRNIYFFELSKKFGNNYMDFVNMVRKKYDILESQRILDAYEFASKAHFDQKRLSGEPFVTHPLNVAYVLAQTGFDSDTICAALLHDVAEDTNYTLDDIRNIFGNTVATLVDGVTKMNGSNFISKKLAEIKTHKKILNGITVDARIIAIKLVDRLHNMYTLDYLKEEKQKQIAHETMDFYVNLARILGIYQVKDELEDLSLFILDKDEFLRIYELRKKLYEIYKDDYKYIDSSVKEKLNDIGICLTTNYKVKNVGGIFSKFANNFSLEEIKDLVSVRMVTKNANDCYTTLGVVCSMFIPVPNSYRDLISSPKYNGYQTLITNVVTPNDSEFQVRIRTEDMQKKNELGMVSNWNLETQKYLELECSNMFKANKKELKMKGRI